MKTRERLLFMALGGLRVLAGMIRGSDRSSDFLITPKGVYDET